MAPGAGGNTGGDDGTDTENGWDNEASSTLWGWLTSIFGGLEAIWEAVTDLPQLIADKLSGFFNDVKDAVTGLGDTILEGIKGIFIPDVDAIEDSFNGFLKTLNTKFNFDTDFFEELGTGEAPVQDVTIDYKIPGIDKNFTLKVFDTKFLIDGVEYFRPFIRGFIVLMMALYNIRMWLSFIRQDAGVATGKAIHMSTRQE